jgi:hypothetical protein
VYVHVNVHVCLCVQEREEDSKGVSEMYHKVRYTLKVVAYYYTEWDTTDLTNLMTHCDNRERQSDRKPLTQYEEIHLVNQ